MCTNLKNFAQDLGEELQTNINIEHNALTISTDKTNIITTLSILHKNRFEILVDILAVDYYKNKKRFEVIYLLLSIVRNLRISVKIAITEECSMPSAVNIFSSANWLEREVYDMHGIHFDDHPDLRRILSDYGFRGHPLKKDFPLTGYVELRYDIEAKRVKYNPVDLTQDFRTFDFISPWEGTKYFNDDTES